jgi:hypothetical protein
MERVEGSVRRELERFGPGDAGVVAILRAWPGAVGAENARRAWPARLGRDGTLLVHATDSIWAYQLGMLGAEIAERLRAELGESAPARLKFVPGPVPTPPPTPSGGSAGGVPSVEQADAAAGAELAAAIEDEKLRETVARAAAASLARARSDRGF